MIEVVFTEDKKEGKLVTFLCPSCGAADTPYLGMVRRCYACDFEHRANVEHLMEFRQERINYHFRKETVWGMGR
jgi:hypothetical protein